ncbi:MAG: ATP-binding protein [Candidatus Methanofastidiosia archaeon]|jgi:MinD superfamily P-loop ATPase
MKIVVASGKGGTGKTTVSVNLAVSLSDVQLLDCDVEEPDCNIYLKYPLTHLEDVHLLVPEIDKEKCTFCGKCAEFCQNNALAVFPDKVVTFPDLCTGCGGCTIICPENAITEKQKKMGVLEHGGSTIHFIRGVLDIGEAMATPIITALKQHIDTSKTVILDSPPGNGCPVVETVSDCDFCILVTEPTPFGLHDLELAVKLTQVLHVPCGVIINKAGIGDKSVQKFCKTHDIPILLEIPHDRTIAELCSNGIPFVQKMPEWKPTFCSVYHTIEEII